MSLKIHHAIVKSLSNADLVAVAHPTEAGMVSIQMEGVEIVAGPLDDVKALARKAIEIVSAEDFDLDEHRQEGDEGEGEGEGQGDEGGDGTTDADEAEEGAGSVVKAAYRKKYREIGAHDSNGDQIALAMRAAVTTQKAPEGESKAKPQSVMSLDTLLAIAEQNGLATPGGKNPGQMRMNLGNMLRGMLNRGTAITIGDTEIQPTEEAKAKAQARFDAERARQEAAAQPKRDPAEVKAERNARAKAKRAVRAAQKAEPKADEPATQETEQQAA